VLSASDTAGGEIGNGINPSLPTTPPAATIKSSPVRFYEQRSGNAQSPLFGKLLLNAPRISQEPFNHVEINHFPNCNLISFNGHQELKEERQLKLL